MWKKIGVLIVILSTITTQAQEIATCRKPTGKSFYHLAGLLDKQHSGWSDDQISKGVFTLRKLTNDTFDILYIDINNKPTSSTQDGALVKAIRYGETSITLLVYYPTITTEIYSFFQEKDGGFRFSLMQSKTGDDAILSKSTLMVGICDPIKFDLLR